MLAAVALWEVEQDLVASVNDIFYFLIDMVNEILTTNPKIWAENHGIWSVIENINNSLITVAIQLAVIFYLIGFVEKTINIKEQISIIEIMMLFVRIALTEYFITNSLEIISELFDIVTNIVGLTTVTSRYINQVGMASDIMDMSAISNIVFLFPTILYLIIVPACAGIIVLQALKRLFKIYLAVPYGVLAFSTIGSGSREISQTAPGFVKYMLSVLLEGFSLALALQIGLKLCLAGQGFVNFNSLNAKAHLIPATLKIMQNIINIVILTVICHMSETLAQRALRLDR